MEKIRAHKKQTPSPSMGEGRGGGEGEKGEGEPISGWTLFGKFLFKRILYLGEKNYLIHRDGRIEEVGTDYGGKVRLVVLEKKYYFETLKTFPFSSIRDIRSAVELDFTTFSPFKTNKFFMRKLGDTGEGAKVNLWFIDEQIAERLNALSPLFLIPESALLSFLDEGAGRVYTIHTKDQKGLSVYIGADGVVKSMTSSGKKEDLQHFRSSVGAEVRDCPVRDISGIEEYLSLFPTILYSMPVKKLLYFLDLGSVSLKLNKKHLKMGLATAAALFFFYTGSSALLPYFTEKRLQQEDKALSRNLSGLLEKQEMVGHYHKKQKELAERINSYTYKMLLMNLLNRLLPQEARISQLTVSGNMVEMRGIAPKASDLLSVLSQAEGIKNAQFTSPLREDRKTGMEIFAITFIYEY